MSIPTNTLITGATGKVGRRVVEQLAGRPGVRALAHSDASAARLGDQDVDLVRGDLADPGPFLDGVEALMLISPYTQEQEAVELGVLQAARAAGVRRVVTLSSLLEDWDVAVMRAHRAVSEAVADSGLEWSVLQPDNFMDNEAEALDLLGAGTVVAPTGAGRFSFVDARDIAAVAVAELTAERAAHRRLVITGPQALTYGEYATALGQSLGRELRHVSPPDEQFAQALRDAGLPGFYAADLTEMYAAVRERGLTHEPTDVVARHTGHQPRDATTFAREVLAPALAAADRA